MVLFYERWEQRRYGSRYGFTVFPTAYISFTGRSKQKVNPLVLSQMLTSAREKHSSLLHTSDVIANARKRKTLFFLCLWLALTIPFVSEIILCEATKRKRNRKFKTNTRKTKFFFFLRLRTQLALCLRR